MKPERREHRPVPQAWEPYLTGQVDAEPHDASWVSEQLTFYGLLQPDIPLPPDTRRGPATAAALAQQGYQASTRARKTHAIKGFIQFLVDAEVLSQNPFATIPSPRVEQRERRVLSTGE